MSVCATLGISPAPSVPDGRPARLELVCFIARNLSLCSLRHAALVELQLLRKVTAVQLIRLPGGLFHPDWESFLTHRALET